MIKNYGRRSSVSKPKKYEFVVHCIMCGKDFRVGDKAECGGLLSGKPMCKTGDIQRALDERLGLFEQGENDVRLPRA